MVALAVQAKTPVRAWTVAPAGPGSSVTVKTSWQGAGGIGGFFEKTFAPLGLRKIQAATDAQRDPPPVPAQLAGKLRAFGLVTPNGRGGPAITDRGREALLEQDMRDAEDR